MEITFAPASVEDADALMAVQNLAFAEDRHRYGECPSYIGSRATMVRKIEDAIFYEILGDGRIVGGIEAYPRGEGHYHLYMLCVHPEHQNKGIGARALAFLFARHPEATFWTLVTPKDNPLSRHLYEKMGFRNAGERQVSDALTLVRYERGTRPEAPVPVGCPAAGGG